MNIILGLTGSVATTLMVKLREELKKLGEVRVVATESAMYLSLIHISEPTRPY